MKLILTGSTPAATGACSIAKRTRFMHGLYVSVFYNLVIASMLVRAIDAQLEENPSEELVAARDELKTHLAEWTRIIDDNLTYSPIPIQALVAVRYGAMLAVLNNL